MGYWGKDLLYGFRGNFVCGTQRVVPSGQDGSILPVRLPNHSVQFGSSCHVINSNTDKTVAIKSMKTQLLKITQFPRFRLGFISCFVRSSWGGQTSCTARASTSGNPWPMWIWLQVVLYFASLPQTLYFYYSKTHVVGFLQHFDPERPLNY